MPTYVVVQPHPPRDTYHRRSHRAGFSTASATAMAIPVLSETLPLLTRVALQTCTEAMSPTEAALRRRCAALEEEGAALLASLQAARHGDAAARTQHCLPCHARL